MYQHVVVVLVLAMASQAFGQGDGSREAAEEKADKKELIDLKRRVEILESRAASQSEEESTGLNEGGSLSSSWVDLSSDEIATLHSTASSTLAKRWSDRFEFWGFGAVGYLDSGKEGTRSDGGFLIKESTLFLEAEVWEDQWYFFSEIQINRLGKDDSLFLRTGETYVGARNLLEPNADANLGLKVGRFDIPFGEEYLSQDAIDNPFISTSAAYPYGFDEGVLLYGEIAGVGWVASISDGTDERSLEDNPAKAVNLKFSGEPIEDLYTSVSVMRNGSAGKSAFEFGGSHFQPIGASHTSSLGASNDDMVNADLYEVDIKFALCDCFRIAAAFGQAFVEDRDRSFDRDLTWFSLEPHVEICSSVYAAIRYSEIGTYSPKEGYHFDGKSTAGGNSAYGYDTKRFKRLSLALGWRPNPQVLIKAEIGVDQFDLIDAATLNPDYKDRILTGLELVVAF